MRPDFTRNDDESREYDFSDGERGRYSHLFGESAEDEALVAAFWKEKGVETQRFAKNETRLAKTPDFKLYQDAKLIAYCEVKTFKHDEWLDKLIEKASPGEIVGAPRPDPTYNRITNAIHTASKQLEAVNPKHEHLNFLVLVNRDKTTEYRDLESVLTGYWDPFRGIFEKTHTAYSEGRIKEEKRKTDLYVWLEPSLNRIPAPGYGVFFGTTKDEVRNRICGMLGLNPDKIKNYR